MERASYVRSRFLTISFNERKALCQGWSIRWWDFLFYASFAFIITSSLRIAGVLVVFSFLIVPAVCATLLADRMDRQLPIGWGIGFLVSALGCSLSYIADLPTGPTVVCAFGLFLLLLAVFRSALRRGQRDPIDVGGQRRRI